MVRVPPISFFEVEGSAPEVVVAVVWKLAGHEADVAAPGVSFGAVVDAAMNSVVPVAASSVEGGAVMPIMSSYWEAAPSGKSSKSLGSHCTVN